MSRRKWFVAHGWIGLTAGLMLFVICWSGSVAVFSSEIDWLLNPRMRVTATLSEPPWTGIRQEAVKTFPHARVLQISRPLYERFPVEVILLRPGERMWRIYADPASGRILDDTSYFNVQRFFRSFHMNLFFISEDFDLGYWGFRLVESFGFALLASMVTSLVFYRRWWQRFFKLERRRGRRIFWSDLHKLTGLWSLWFVPLIAVTGVWYLVEEFVPGSPGPPATPDASESTGRAPMLEDMVEAARGAIPDFHVSRVWLGEEDSGLVEVYGYDGALLVRDRASKVWIDPRDASVVRVQRTADLTALQRWIDTADPVHFGNFGGLWSKSVWFVFGLALSAMSLTGAYLHVQRQRRKHAETGYRAPVLVAYGLTTLILVVAAVGGWFEIRSYGLPVDGAARFPAVALPVTVFVGSWVASTLVALFLWVWKLR
ncbi:MAG: PepSY-associated TM helix domain-containing protein [Woeseia sp.]